MRAASAVAIVLIAGLGDAEAANLHARPSTPFELALATDGQNGSDVSIGAVLVGDDVLWETPDGLMWHRVLGPTGTFGPNLGSFGPGAELSIVVPYFDYNRAAAYDLQARRLGNEFQLDEFRVIDTLQLSNFVIPHDLAKEYVKPIGGLAKGEYLVEARSFSITTANPADIDFDAFRADPLGYDLPAGSALSVQSERINFSVVPEPATAGLMLGGQAVMVRMARRRRSEK